jgi:uncharacterized membrane protein
METNEVNGTLGFIPKTGPSYNKGWDVMWATFIELLVVTIVYAFINIPAGGVRFGATEFEWYFIPIIFFGIVYGIFIAGPIGYSVSWVFLKAVRKEKINIKDMFSVFERNYWNTVVASLITGVIVFFGIIMLIVPGIIFACRLAFVPYLVIDQKMDVMDALKTSWDMTKGHGWSIFFIGLLAIPIFIAGFIMLFFGVFISAIWISSAFAVIYHAVCLEKGQYLTAVNGESV